MELQTPHLKLIPYSPGHLLALIEGVAQFKEQFGLPVAEGLREFLVSDEVSPEWLAALQTATETDPWVHGFAVIHVEYGLVIGTAGFYGPPENGLAEIAYGIAPGYQGRGYATEAAQALIEFASSSGTVTKLRAHTLPGPNASTSVLTKCGFTHTGEINHPDDGLVWRWELSGW